VIRMPFQDNVQAMTWKPHTRLLQKSKSTLFASYEKHIERTAAVTKQEMSLKSVLMNYLGFVSTPRPHDADSWVEVSPNPCTKQ